MRLIAHFIFSIFSNFVALEIASFFVSGFMLSTSLVDRLEVVFLLTFINLFIKPFLKFIFSPVIIITMGVGMVFLNVALLYLLSWLSSGISFMGFLPLLYTSLIIGFVNMIINFSAKLLYKKRN